MNWTVQDGDIISPSYPSIKVNLDDISKYMSINPILRIIDDKVICIALFLCQDIRLLGGIIEYG